MLNSNFLSEKRLLFRTFGGSIDDPGASGPIDLPGVSATPAATPVVAGTDPVAPTTGPTDPTTGPTPAVAAGPTESTPEGVLTPEATERGKKRIKVIKDFDEARTSFKDSIPRLGAVLRNKDVVPQRWHFESENSLKAMWDDFGKLRLPLSSPFYVKLREQLWKPYTGKEGAEIMKRGDSEKGGINFYRNPHVSDHAEWLKTYDNDYYNAVLFVEGVRQTLIDKMKADEDIAKRKDKENSNPLFRTVTDHLQRGGKDLAKAFEKKDYGLIALYATGIWAGWKVLKPMFGDAHGHGGGHGDGDIDLKKLLLWGTAAYAGYHIADRAGFNIGKKLGLEDKNSDVRGTVYANMAAAGVEGSGAIDAGLLLSLNETPVKSMHKAYKEAKGSAFIHPDQFPGAFSALKGKRPLDINNPKTADQRFYVETGKKLFMLMDSIIVMYGQVPNRTKTFEEEFVNPADNIIFADLGFWFSQYYSAEGEKVIWKRGDGLDAAREGLKGLTGISYHFEQPLEGGHIKGYVNSFPVVFVQSHDKKSYTVKDFAGYQKNKVAETLAVIPVEAGQSQELAVRKLEAAVKEKMLLLIAPLEVSGGVPDIQFDGSKWYGEVQLAGAEEFGLTSEKVLAYFYPLPNGQGIEVEYNGMRMPLNWAMEKEHNFNAPLITELVNSRPEYATALLPFVRSGQLKLVEPDPKVGEFKLIVADIKDYALLVEVKVERDPTNPKKVISRDFIINADSVKRLLGRQEFGDRYSKAVDNSPETEEVFKRFKNILRGAPESFIYHFIKRVPGWFSNATGSSLLRGVTLDSFTGSIPDQQITAILEAKKSMMRDKLKFATMKAGNLEQLRAVKSNNYDPALIELELLINRFSVENLERIRDGKDWSAVDFNKEIFEPLSKVGSNTATYAGILGSFQADVYGLLYGKDDLRKKGHAIASRVITVFSYHTAVLDEGLDDVELGLIDQPLVASDDPRKLAQQRAIEAAQKIKYMKQLNNHLIEVAKRKSDHLKDVTPPPTDVIFWELEKFVPYSNWLSKPDNALVSSVDITDGRPVLKFGKSHYIEFGEYEKLEGEAKTKEGREVIFRGKALPEPPESGGEEFVSRLGEAIERKTDLEKEYIKAFKGYLASIKREAMKDKDFKPNAIQDFENEYLDPRLYFDEEKTTFIKFPYSSTEEYNQLVAETESDGTFQAPEFWSDIESLQNIMASSPNLSRAAQKELIESRVRAVINSEIFAEYPGTRTYFRNVSWWTDVKAWWVDLTH